MAKGKKDSGYADSAMVEYKTGTAQIVAPNGAAIRIERLARRFKNVTAIDCGAFNVGAGRVCAGARTIADKKYS
jgi:hypothetical protein